MPHGIAELANRNRKLAYSAAQLRDAGADLAAEIADDVRLNVLRLNENPIVKDKESGGKYVVRSGDTICQIAEEFKVGCKKLMRANNINAKGKIYRDQELTIPGLGAQPPVGKETSNEATIEQKSAGKWKINTTQQSSPTRSANEADAAQEKSVYFYTHENFYVITRYNQSVLYAMAVNDLSNAIAAEFARSKSD